MTASTSTGPLALAIDIGGTKTLLGVLDADGCLLRETRIPTPRGDAELAVAELVRHARDAVQGLRLAAISGFVMTLLYAVLSIFPIIDVKDAASFTVKVSAVVIGINVAGALYFRHAQRKRYPR